jgi:hypothetical protein
VLKLIRNDRRVNIPHASQQLDKTTIGECESYDNVGVTDAFGVDIDQGQHERGERESRQTQRSGVGEFAVRWPVETGLEVTTKGSQAHFRVVGSYVCERVAAIVVRYPLLRGACSGMVDRAGAVGIFFVAGSAL